MYLTLESLFENTEFSDETSEEESDEPEPVENYERRPTDCSIHCRCIRVGSYRVYPYNNSPHLTVNLREDSISFPALALNSLEQIPIYLRSPDITKVLVHLGKLLPVMFVYTTARFGQRIRDTLNMEWPEENYFDPESENYKVQILTFLINSMTSGQRYFLRNCFARQTIEEIDHREANIMLFRTSPL